MCVLVSLGLLELAKLPPSGQKKQEFILPQLWRPDVQNQGVSRLWRLWRSVLLCRFQPLVAVSCPWLVAASSLCLHLRVASSSVCLSSLLSLVRKPVIGFGTFQGRKSCKFTQLCGTFLGLRPCLFRFPGGARAKEPTSQCRRCKRQGFDPWVGKIPWRRAQQPTPVFLPRESHGQRSLAGYSLWGCKESDTTEATEHIFT